VKFLIIEIAKVIFGCKRLVNPLSRERQLEGVRGRRRGELKALGQTLLSLPRLESLVRYRTWIMGARGDSAAALSSAVENL
jgi:hypothetical protein